MAKASNQPGESDITCLLSAKEGKESFSGDDQNKERTWSVRGAKKTWLEQELSWRRQGRMWKGWCLFSSRDFSNTSQEIIWAWTRAAYDWQNEIWAQRSKWRWGGIADLNTHYFEKGSKELKLSRSLYLCHDQHIKFSSLEISWSLFVTVQGYWILDKWSPAFWVPIKNWRSSSFHIWLLWPLIAKNKKKNTKSS